MVKIYSIPSCPYCVELKEILTTEGIAFTDVDVSLSENSEEFDKIYNITKSDEVPVVLIGKQILVPNVSFTTIRQGADLIKQFLA